MRRDDILELFGASLNYMSYYHRRHTSSAERLSHIFPRADAFERQYQEDLRSGPTEAA